LVLARKGGVDSEMINGCSAVRVGCHPGKTHLLRRKNLHEGG